MLDTLLTFSMLLLRHAMLFSLTPVFITLRLFRYSHDMLLVCLIAAMPLFSWLPRCYFRCCAAMLFFTAPCCLLRCCHYDVVIIMNYQSQYGGIGIGSSSYAYCRRHAVFAMRRAPPPDMLLFIFADMPLLLICRC